jgi:hypothetical protein
MRDPGGIGFMVLKAARVVRIVVGIGPGSEFSTTSSEMGKDDETRSALVGN